MINHNKMMDHNIGIQPAIEEFAQKLMYQARNGLKKHVDEFVKLKCSPVLLELGLFPNAKEITESMAAFHAVRKFLVNRGILGEKALKRDDITVLVPGDGHVPRTGALFAHRSNWRVVSVDPCMRDRDYKTKRLTAIRDKVENIEVVEDEVVIIAAVHSHAKLSESVKKAKGKHVFVVSMSCCVPDDLKWPLIRGYVDAGVWSPENNVRVYESPDNG